MDKTKPADWITIKPQSIITLSDAQAIADSMRRGLGVRGINYTVTSIERCEHLSGFSTHLFLTLSDTEQTMYLLVKIVDDLIDLYAFFEAPIEGGQRSALLERDMFWLFQEPSDPEHFTPSELRYTMTFSQTIPNADGGSETELLYRQKSQGELQCRHTQTPPRKGLPPSLLATIVEYKTDQATENPEFLILEVGEERSSHSFVRFFLGCPIQMSEVDILGI